MESGQQCQYAYSLGNHFRWLVRIRFLCTIKEARLLFGDSIEEDEAALYDGDYK